MNVTIDTCSWINLANEYPEKNYLSTLEMLVNSGKVKLVIPEIVKSEWEKHKIEKVYNCKLNSFKTKIKHAKSISNLLINKDQIYQYEHLVLQINRTFSKAENEANKSIRIIDSLLENKNTEITTATDDLKIMASNWAIEKLPPFGAKNSMKDALIFLSVVDFLKDKTTEQNYLISDNFTDFATNSQKDNFAGHLKSLSDGVNLKYLLNVPIFLKEIESIIGYEIEESCDSILAKTLFEKEELIKRLKISGSCHICGNEIKQSWLRSFTIPGPSLHLICSNCGYDIDTLELWD